MTDHTTIAKINRVTAERDTAYRRIDELCSVIGGIARALGVGDPGNVDVVTFVARAKEKIAATHTEHYERLSKLADAAGLVRDGQGGFSVDALLRHLEGLRHARGMFEQTRLRVAERLGLEAGASWRTIETDAAALKARADDDAAKVAIFAKDHAHVVATVEMRDLFKAAAEKRVALDAEIARLKAELEEAVDGSMALAKQRNALLDAAGLDAATRGPSEVWASSIRKMRSDALLEKASLEGRLSMAGDVVVDLAKLYARHKASNVDDADPETEASLRGLAILTGVNIDAIVPPKAAENLPFASKPTPLTHEELKTAAAKDPALRGLVAGRVEALGKAPLPGFDITLKPQGWMQRDGVWHALRLGPAHEFRDTLCDLFFQMQPGPSPTFAPGDAVCVKCHAEATKSGRIQPPGLDAPPVGDWELCTRPAGTSAGPAVWHKRDEHFTVCGISARWSSLVAKAVRPPEDETYAVCRVCAGLPRHDFKPKEGFTRKHVFLDGKFPACGAHVTGEGSGPTTVDGVIVCADCFDRAKVLLHDVGATRFAVDFPKELCTLLGIVDAKKPEAPWTMIPVALVDELRASAGAILTRGRTGTYEERSLEKFDELRFALDVFFRDVGRLRKTPS